MEAKRAPALRKRRLAQSSENSCMVEVSVPELEEQPRAEWKRETFSDLAKQADYMGRNRVLEYRAHFMERP